MRRRRLVTVIAALVLAATASGCLAPGGAAPPHPPPPPWLVAAVEAHFGDQGPYVVECFYGIAWKESGYVAEAVSPGGTYLGTVQIAASSDVWRNMAWNLGRPLNPFDPWDHFAAARSLYESWRARYGDPFGPWKGTRGACR